MQSLELFLKCPECRKEVTLVVRPESKPEHTCSQCGQLLMRIRVVNGYVYVLSNPRMPGLLKIGHTGRCVEERVQELNSATGVPAPFLIEAYFPSMQPQEHEAEIYHRLLTHRIGDREFFDCDAGKVLAVIEEVVGWPPSYLRPELAQRTGPPAGTVRIERNEGVVVARWECRKCGADLSSTFRQYDRKFEKTLVCPHCGQREEIREHWFL